MFLLVHLCSAVLRVSVDVDEMAGTVVASHDVARHELQSPGMAWAKKKMSKLLGNVACSGNCSTDVCRHTGYNPHTLHDSEDAVAVARYDKKQQKLTTLAEYLADKSCTYRLVGGLGEFRDQLFPRSCAQYWHEFDKRMMSFRTCRDVEREDGYLPETDAWEPHTMLAGAVWGFGSDVFKAAHTTLDAFMKNILTLLHTAYNDNVDIQSMLELGGCTLDLNILADELVEANQRTMDGMAMSRVLGDLDAKIFGPSCDFEKAKMPWMYLRMRLLKSIRSMVHGIVQSFMDNVQPNFSELMERSMDVSKNSDDPDVEAFEQQLDHGILEKALHDDDFHGDFDTLPPPGDTSLVEMGHEPIITTTVVTVSMAVIIAALIGGAAVLAIIATVLRSLMMTRRIKTRGGA